MKKMGAGGLPDVPTFKRSDVQTVPLNPLSATLMDPLASVANKRLTAMLNLLDATLTKKRGLGEEPT